jgi:hypothetical protein
VYLLRFIDLRDHDRPSQWTLWLHNPTTKWPDNPANHELFWYWESTIFIIQRCPRPISVLAEDLS